MIDQRMLTASSMNQEIAGIMQMIFNSDLGNARKRVLTLAPSVKTERMRGSLAAVNGMIASMTRKEGGQHPWEEEKVLRGAHQMMRSQLLDDFDRGYSETLMKYGKISKSTKPRE